MHETNTALMELAMSAAMGAGRELRQLYGQRLRQSHKGTWRDVVSEADRAAEDRAIEIVQRAAPQARIVCEERGALGDPLARGQWVIDALDGSVNYLHQVPLFSVSVAYVEQGQVQAASVYMPLADELYYAARGQGAYKNQQVLRVLELPPSQSLFAAAFSGKAVDPARRAQEYLAFGRVNDASCGCLRTGSAALNLAYLAEGKFNGCWGKASKLWDIAAGVLLAEEAGAQVVLSPASDDGVQFNFIAAPASNFSFLSEQVQPIF